MTHFNFLVNGEYLDIEQGLSLTFKRENMAFAYGKLKLDRTASFEVPATGKNNRLFGIANNPARSGNGTPMRKKVECYLQAGGVETRGYLYIQSAKRDSYSCVFVSGQFLPLMNLSEKKIKEHTSLKNALVTDGFGGDGEGNPVPPWKGGKATAEQYATNLSQFAVMPLIYKSNTTEKNVCVNLAYLMSECSDLFGVNVDLPNNINRYPPLTAIAPKFPLLDNENISISQVQEPLTGVPFVKTTLNLYPWGITYFRANPDGDAVEQNAKSCLNFFFEGTKIKFPQDFPDNVFLVSIGNVNREGKWMNTQPYMLNFVGDYRFSYDATSIDTYIIGSSKIYGTPLAGKEVEIPSSQEKWTIKAPDGKEYEVYYQPFLFVRKEDFVFERVGGGSALKCMGIKPSLLSKFDAKISQEDLPVGGVMTIERNARTFLSQFIPDISYIDLLNVYRYVYGLRFVYDDATATLSFDDYNFMLPDKPSLDLKNKLISVDSVKREVEDFGQSNKIKFKQNDNIIYNPMTSPFTIKNGIEYKIDNDLIKRDNTLFTIPFSSGDAKMRADSFGEFEPDLICNDIESKPIEGKYQTEYELKERNKEYTIGFVGFGYIARVTYPELIRERNDLNTLCKESTKVQAKFKLSLFEFNSLNEDSVIYFGGVRYVWLSATWSKGVATLTLQKI